jgi:hypothetical protein
MKKNGLLLLFLLINVYAAAQKSIWVGLSGSVRINASSSDMREHIYGMSVSFYPKHQNLYSISYALMKAGIPIQLDWSKRLQLLSGVDLIYRDIAIHGRYTPVNSVSLVVGQIRTVAIPLNIQYKIPLNDYISIAPFLGYYLEVWGKNKSVDILTLNTDSTSDGLILNSRSRMIHYIDPGIALEAITGNKGKLRITLQSYINIRENFNLDFYSSSLGVKTSDGASFYAPLHYWTFSVQYLWKLKLFSKK